MAYDMAREMTVLFGGFFGSTYNGETWELEVRLRIVQSPQSQTATVGQPATFVVQVVGTGSFTYQWRKDGVNLIDDGRISGATTDMLTIDPVQLPDAGCYDVVVTNDCGTVTSEGAMLTVNGILGDLNCDGAVNAFDIDPFVLALTAPSQYAIQYPDCDIWLADINGDGWIDAFDIDPFVELLTGG